MPAPTPYIPSVAVDAVMSAIGTFLVPFLAPNTPVIRAYDNDVATPPDPYVELIEITRQILETSSSTYSGANQQAAVTSPMQIDVQINFVGTSAAEQCFAVAGVVRSGYAAAMFPAGISPLYSDGGRCNPMVNGEQQYDYRWTLTLSLQYNPTVYIPQLSSDTLTVATREALK